MTSMERKGYKWLYIGNQVHDIGVSIQCPWAPQACLGNAVPVSRDL